MFLARCKYFFSTVGAVALSLALLFCVWAMGSSRFSTLQGERVYYLHSPSSQAEMKKRLSLRDMFFVEGESVQISFTDGEKSAFVAEIRRFFSEVEGTFLFAEAVDGVQSFYCYSPKLSDGILIGGEYVNLHIAVGEGRCVVGSPIIFGGF